MYIPIAQDLVHSIIVQYSCFLFQHCSITLSVKKIKNCYDISSQLLLTKGSRKKKKVPLVAGPLRPYPPPPPALGPSEFFFF